MIAALPSHPDHARLERQGWLLSTVFHAVMGTCAITLVSGLRMPVESDQFKWNVALVQASKSPAQADPLPESKPEPKPIPPKPQVTKQPAPPEPVIETVQRKLVQPVQAVPQVVQRQVVQTVHQASQLTTVNQTASTVIAQSVQQPVTSHEAVTKEAPMVTTDSSATQETAQPVVTEPLVSRHVAEPVTQRAPVQPIGEPVAQSQPAVNRYDSQELVERPAVASESGPARQSQQPAAVEQAVTQTAASRAVPATKADYSWLMKALLGRIDQLKNYPHMARLNHWEGKVVLRAVIKDDGQVLTVDVYESSGRPILDNDAVETLRRASPLKLEHPLGKSQVAILMPISYSLR